MIGKTVRLGAEAVRRKKETGATWREIAEEMRVKAPTLRRYVQLYRAEQERTMDRVPERGEYASVTLDACVYDIETTDFGTDGNYGQLICCSVLPLDSDEVITVVRDFDELDDRGVLWRAIELLQNYDILIGHNIIRFDAAWMSSRLAYWNLPPTRRWFTIDTFNWAQRAKLKTRKSLANLTDYFDLDGIKTSIQRSSWSGALSRKREEFDKTIKQVVYHCEQDVIANRGLFDALYPRIMSARYSSSNPIGIFDQGMGVGDRFYSGEEPEW